jgi:aspartyl-tRNA(Asn)/glutamyl-tRNA(Gln) amidotransferase subunit B
MSATFESVIGLEVHAQLRTASKLFSRASTSYGDAPNTHIDPVVLGLPGALPVPNKEAVRMAVMVGLALDCQIRGRSVFARKNYFYPDLPKGYQISQHDLPLCERGHLDIELEGGQGKRVGITRIHMEEDAGKSIHAEGAPVSFINLNRAGVALVEIVSEPDMRSAEEAVAYLKELRSVLVYLGVCDGNMEEGSFRCDANVSIRPRGQEELGTRCEIKNMNSFRSVREAIAFEIARQSQLLLRGEQVVQQTRLWNQASGRTEAMRSKEDAHDYRYFPEPDLLPLEVTDSFVSKLRETLPELPAGLRARLQEAYGLSAGMSATLSEDRSRAQAFERALGEDADPARSASLANFLMTNITGAMKRSERPWADVEAAMEQLAVVHDRWRAGKLSNQMMTRVLDQAFDADRPLPAAVQAALEAVGEVVSDDNALGTAVDEVLAGLTAEVERYRAGDKKLFGFFMGQVMRKLRGKADAKSLSRLLRERLDS